MQRERLPMSQQQNDFLEQLYYKHFNQLTIYATASLNDAELAKDIVQDTFHEAVKKIGVVMKHENPGGWLMVVLKNKIKEYKRAHYRYMRRFLSLDTDFDDNIGAMDMRLNEVEEDDVKSIVERIKKVLSPEDYRLLSRFAFDNASHLDVAKEFGISVYASQKRLERIRKKIHKLFPD